MIFSPKIPISTDGCLVGRTVTKKLEVIAGLDHSQLNVYIGDSNMGYGTR